MNTTGSYERYGICAWIAACIGCLALGLVVVLGMEVIEWIAGVFPDAWYGDPHS